jgi:hypothetical protein
MLTTAIILMVLLQLKHFIVDFPLQGPFQYKNKGTYGHSGGLLHAFNHGIGTYFAIGGLSYFYPSLTLPLAAGLAAADMAIHYHVDWAKMKLNAKLGWGPTTHEEFWWLLGLDQLLHQLTYVWIIYMAVAK